MISVLITARALMNQSWRNDRFQTSNGTEKFQLHSVSSSSSSSYPRRNIPSFPLSFLWQIVGGKDSGVFSSLISQLHFTSFAILKVKALLIVTPR